MKHDPRQSYLFPQLGVRATCVLEDGKRQCAVHMGRWKWGLKGAGFLPGQFLMVEEHGEDWGAACRRAEDVGRILEMQVLEPVVMVRRRKEMVKEDG